MISRPVETTVQLLLHPRFVPVCLAFHLLLRAALILWVPISPFSDASWYFNRAADIAAGKGYSEQEIPTAYWPIGWPGFLALLFQVFGPYPLVGQLANLALSSLIFFLTLWLGRAIFKVELGARTAVLLLTFYPNNIVYVSILLSETFFTALLLLGCWLYVTKSSIVSILGSGAIFGLATLTRTQTLFVPLILIGLRFLLEPGHRLKLRTCGYGIALYAAIFVVIAPWTYRNYQTFGHFVLVSTNGGLTLLTGNNPSARGDYTPDDPLVAAAQFSVRDQVAADQRATELALQWVRNNPMDFVKLLPRKIWRLWAPDGEAEWAYQSGFSNYDNHRLLFRLARVLNQAYYTLLITIGLMAAPLFLFRRVNRHISPWSLFGFALALYTSAISLLFSGQSRFHFPVMPFVTMYCGWMFHSWVTRNEIELGREFRSSKGFTLFHANYYSCCMDFHSTMYLAAPPSSVIWRITGLARIGLMATD